MGHVFLLWLLVSLLSISLVGEFPFPAFCLAVGGGCSIGIFLFNKQKDDFFCMSVKANRVGLWACKYEVPMVCVAVFVLLFSNRLPIYICLISIVFLLFPWIYRKITTGQFLMVNPMNLPILLLFAASTFGLCASANLRLSIIGLAGLFAGIVLFYGLVNRVNTHQEVQIGIFVLLICGIGITLVALFVMRLSPAKLPLIPRIYYYLPDVLPRKVHFNYVGGTLTFFFPLVFWCFVFKYGRLTLWFGAGTAIIGIGLLMTQSRGSLLGTVVALAVTGAGFHRWMRWALLPLGIGGSVLIYVMGLQTFLDSMGIMGPAGSLVGRQELWTQAIHIVQDFPFTGIGMHMFPVIIDLLYPLFLSGPNAQVPHAHNLYLQVAVDTGLPGLVAFWMLLGVLGSLVWDAFKLAFNGCGKDEFKPLILGLGGGIIAHLIYSMTDAITLGEKAGVFFWAVQTI